MDMKNKISRSLYGIFIFIMIVSAAFTCSSEAESDFDRLAEKIKAKEARDTDDDDDDDDGNGTGSCDENGYKGPEFDIQVDSQCKAAYFYECSGNAQGVAAACAVYKQWQQDDPSIPNCPYCN